MKVLEGFIERPVGTSLLALALVLMGILGLRLLPVAPLPQIDFPVIQVRASLPGASPESMAASVATPLERAFSAIAGLDRMSSTSTRGSSEINLRFSLDKDINEAAREVQAAINASRHLLPSGMPGNPQYRKLNPSQAPIMALALSSDTLPPSELFDLADTVLAQKIARIRGVGEVQVGGGSLPAVRVELEPHALAHHGIALDQVRDAIVAANVRLPKGSLDGERWRWRIDANDQLDSAADYRRLILSTVDGAPVRLGDVARVYESVEDRYAGGFHNERAAVIFAVSRQPNANIVDTVDAIYERLPQLQALVPAGADLVVTLDRSPGIRATLREATRTLLIAVGLVVLVVLVFLGRPLAALVPSLAVPVSLIGACAVMYLGGFSLNNLSLMALIVATGLVVDDAIVVMENISRHVEAGVPARRAALLGTREVGFTLVSMNLALMVVFTAILFMGGFVERLFREFSLTLVAAIAISLLVSLTLTPTLCARVLKPRGTRRRPLADRFANVPAAYARSLDWALARPRLLLALLLGATVCTIYLHVAIPKSLLPQQDTGQLQGFGRGDDNLSFQAMQPKFEAFRRALVEDPAVADVVGYVGGRSGVNNAYILMRLKPLDERGESAQAVVERLRRGMPDIPGARLYVGVDQDIRLGTRRGRGDEYRYLLLASDMADLQHWAPRVTEAFRELPELVDVDGDVDEGARQVSLEIDREAARRLGVDVRMVTSVLNNSFSQRQVSTIFQDLNQYRVVLEVAPRYAQHPAALDRIEVITGDGGRVPLSAFSSYHYSIAPDRVHHDGQFAAADISYSLAPGVSLEEANTAIERTIAELMLPTRIQGRLGGDSAALEEAKRDQPLLILAALLTVYIVLGVLYESYIHPLTILSTLPSAGLGALLALMLVDTDFSLISLLGLFLLIGIVMKNAILVVDFALTGERERGLSARESVRNAALLRLRPILMTGIASLLGALPLVLGLGEGGELRRPLGITIVGGLLLSQLLTLYTTPVVYLYLDRFRHWAGRRAASSRDGAGQAETR